MMGSIDGLEIDRTGFETELWPGEAITEGSRTDDRKADWRSPSDRIEKLRNP